MNKPDNILFHSYDLNETSSFRHVLFLFNSVKHLRLQSSKRLRIYEIVDNKTRGVKARVTFSMEGTIATTPLRAPFGFIEMYRKTINQELIDFFQFIESDLKTLGVKTIQLKSYPELYDHQLKLAEAALVKLGYSTHQEVSSIIQVDSKSFERKIKISERQKLRKASKLFSFEKIRANQLQMIYSFIENCRKERNQNLSMSFSDLVKVMKAFPRNFFLFRVYHETETVAAAIVIKVSKEILYTFYYGHARKYDKVSPIVFLISSIYKWGHLRKIKLIDLGTSMLNGGINRSLLHFKKSVGGQSSRKLIFEKNLK